MRQSHRLLGTGSKTRQLVLLAFAAAALLGRSGSAMAAGGSTSIGIRITGWPTASGHAPVSTSVSTVVIAESTHAAGARALQATLRSDAALLAPETLAFAKASSSIAAPNTAVVRNGDDAIEMSDLEARTVAGAGLSGPLGLGLSGTAQVPAGAAAGEYEGDVLVLLSWE